MKQKICSVDDAILLERFVIEMKDSVIEVKLK